MSAEAAERDNLQGHEAPALGVKRRAERTRPRIGSLRLPWPPQRQPRTAFSRRLQLGYLILAALVIATAARYFGQHWLYPLGSKNQNLIVRLARENNLQPSLIASVIRQESHFRPNAQSSAGAVGLMQLLPSTARWVSEALARVPYDEDALVKPEVNLRLGTTYLAYLRDHFGEDPVVYLSAYNAGPQVVEDWLKRQEGQLSIPEIPFPETRAYVSSVLRGQARYGELYPDLDDELVGAESESEIK